MVLLLKKTLPDFSIIVPAFNEEAFIGKTLASIRAAMLHPPGGLCGELVVVDNNSTDQTAALAQAAGATVVFEKINCIARARNAGARAATGRYLIFVDADTLVSPALVNEVLRQMGEERVCGGGATVTFDLELPWAGKRFLWLWNQLVKLHPIAAGSFLFCRKDAWEQTGGFNEKVYAAEEVLFSRALRRWGRAHGYRFRLVPLPTVTSARKFSWYSTWRIMLSFTLFAIFPFAVRSRRLCAIWYERKGPAAEAVPRRADKG